MKNLHLAIILLLSFLFSIKGMAQDAGLSIQGVLRTAENAALENGNYELTFALYNVASGGTALWTETQSEVVLKGGIYSVILGDANPLNVPFDEKYYLGVSVEGGAELIPRAELTSSPYALSLIGEDNIFPNSGNVGIGDPNPNYKLTIKNGSGSIGLDAQYADYLTTISGTEHNVNFNNNGNKDYTFSQNGNERVRVLENGLQVRGDGEAVVYLNGQSSNGLIGFTDKNSTIMNIQNPNEEIRLVSGNNRFYGRAHAYNGLNVYDERSYFYEQLDIRINGRSLALAGDDHSYMSFYPATVGGGEQAKFGFLSANSNEFNLQNYYSGGDLRLGVNGGQIYVEDRLNISGHLQVSGSAQYGLSSYDYLSDTGVGYNDGNADEQIAIWTNGNIRAAVFYADSDKRIKENFKICNAKKDLAILNQLEVTNYNYIDKLNDGAKLKKGLVAQQVDVVYPQAVLKTKDFIPNIFSFPSLVKNNNNTTEITLSKSHEFAKGDLVRIITEKGEETFEVNEIINSKTFSVAQKLSTASRKLFVYGKEVKDFHTVDYDQVFTLCVSAVQELSKKVDALETALSNTENEKVQLKELNDKVTNVNSILKADINDLSDRMKKIEHLLNATGSK